jgi:hypothetical protein
MESSGPWSLDRNFYSWSSSFWSYAEAQTMSRRAQWMSFLESVPPYGLLFFCRYSPPSHSHADPSLSQGRGIVFVSGGDLLCVAMASIRMLRDMGCTLGIELWHLRAELSSSQGKQLSDLAVIPMCFEDHVASGLLQPIDSNVGLRLFQLKALAIKHSSYEEVLLLDSDNTPLRDPTSLFLRLKDLRSSALFWPDYWMTHTENPVWDILDVKARQEWEQESGQILVNKRLAWPALNLCVHLNSPFYMQLLNGDKDTFRFAWMASHTPFTMVPSRALPVGQLSPDGVFCGHTMLQHDLDGSPLFLHHNQLKRRADTAVIRFDLVQRPRAGKDDRTRVVSSEALRLPARTLYCTLLVEGDVTSVPAAASGLHGFIDTFTAALDGVCPLD